MDVVRIWTKCAYEGTTFYMLENLSCINLFVSYVQNSTPSLRLGATPNHMRLQRSSTFSCLKVLPSRYMGLLVAMQRLLRCFYWMRPIQLVAMWLALINLRSVPVSSKHWVRTITLQWVLVDMYGSHVGLVQKKISFSPMSNENSASLVALWTVFHDTVGQTATLRLLVASECGCNGSVTGSGRSDFYNESCCVTAISCLFVSQASFVGISAQELCIIIFMLDSEAARLFRILWFYDRMKTMFGVFAEGVDCIVFESSVYARYRT